MWPGADATRLADLASLGLVAAGERLAAHGLVFLLARLDALPDGLAPPLPSEQIAAARLTPAGGRGYVARRQIARSVLACSLGIGAADIAIRTDDLGRPSPQLPDHLPPYAISFSARGDLAMIGLMRRQPGRERLGVDLENAITEGLIPWNMLHADERRALMDADPLMRHALMLRLWSVKEAIVKAMGQGFRIPPEEVGVLLTASVDDRPCEMRPRIFLRNRAANAAMERATVLTWCMQAGLKDIRPNEDIDVSASAVATAVILDSETQ